jgi:AraC-like DNA-binding protein
MKSLSLYQAIFGHSEDFAASVPGTSVVVTPLAPALFSAELILVRLKEPVLAIGRSTPLMFTGRVSPGTARIVLPLERSEALRLNGLMIRPGDVAIFRPGAGYDGAWADDASWASLTLPDALLAALLRMPFDSWLRRAGAHAVLRADPESWVEVVSLIAAVRQVALEDPQVLTVTEALRGMRADLLEALRELLATAQRSDITKAPTNVAGRRRVVRDVESALKAEPGRILNAKDLCAAIGVMPSHLTAAIETSFGVEPDRYIRLRRLAMERTANRHSAAPEQVAAARSFRDMDSCA